MRLFANSYAAATLCALAPALVALVVGGCGSGAKQVNLGAASNPSHPEQSGADDRARCEFRGRSDREAVETAGPGAVQPNVRRVYQLVGAGETLHKVLVCREIDTNLDGVKDTVRLYNEKGESLKEESDTNHDGKVDSWIIFSSGRIGKQDLDSNFDGQADVWKYYSQGQLARIQRDLNFDGKPDRWEFYVGGKIERMGLDLDYDGHVDRWDHDEATRLAEEASGAGEAKSGGGAADAGAAAADGGPSATGARKRR